MPDRQYSSRDKGVQKELNVAIAGKDAGTSEGGGSGGGGIRRPVRKEPNEGEADHGEIDHPHHDGACCR